MHPLACYAPAREQLHAGPPDVTVRVIDAVRHSQRVAGPDQERGATTGQLPNARIGGHHAVSDLNQRRLERRRQEAACRSGGVQERRRRLVACRSDGGAWAAHPCQEHQSSRP